MTVTIKRIGGSLAVVIPKAVAAEAGLTEGATLDVSPTPGGVVFRKPGRRPRRPLDELIAQMDPEAYRRNNKEFKGDSPVGKEIW